MAGTSGAIRAGKAFVEFFVDNTKLTRGLKLAQVKMRAWAAGISSIGQTIAIAGLAMAAPILLAVKSFASLGDQLDKMSARTGASVEMLSKLGFAAEQSGSSIETLEKGLGAMGRFMVDLQTGSKSATDMMDMMGLSMADLADKTPDERIKVLLDALAGIEDPSIRAGVAMKVLGRAGRELLPMAEGFSALAAEAEELGIVMSTKDAKAAADLTDSWNRMVVQLKMVAVQIGSAVAPALKKLFGQIVPMARTSIEWATANKGLIQSIGKGVVMFAGLGAGLLVVGKVLAIAAAGFGVLATVIGALPSLVGIAAVVAGVVGLAKVTGVSVDAIKGKFSGLGEFVGGIWQSISGTATKALGAIVEKIEAGDLEGAIGVALSAVKVIWFDTIAKLTAAWLPWVGEIKETFGDAVAGMAKMINNFYSGVKLVVEKIRSVLVSAATAFSDAWKTAVREVTRLAAQAAITTTIDPQKRAMAQSGFDLGNKIEDRQRARADSKRDVDKGLGDAAALLKIEQDRLSINKTIDEDRKKARDADRAGTAKAIADAKARAAAARAALEQAVAPGAASVADSGDGAGPADVLGSGGGLMDFKSGLGRGDQRRFVLEQRMAQARQGLGQMINANAGNVGTFSGRAAGQIGAMGPMERIAKDMQQVVENTGRGADAAAGTEQKIDGLMLEAE